MSAEHDHHAPGQLSASGSSYGKSQPDDFGVNKITVHYHWRGEQFEVDLDPRHIDIMIFGSANIKKYKPTLPGKAGGPVKGSMNHLMPDGTMRDHPGHKTRGAGEPWPLERAGIMSAPRNLGMSAGGSPDDFCWHNVVCDWWCVAGNHAPLEE